MSASFELADRRLFDTGDGAATTSVGEEAMITARSMTLRSSRTLPGHE